MIFRFFGKCALHKALLVIWALAFAGAAMSATVAHADGFDIQQFQPMPDVRGNFLTTAAGEVAPHGQLSTFLFFNYASNPLVVLNDDNERIDSLIASQGTLHLLGSYGLLDLFEIGVDLPLIVLQSGSAVPGVDLNTQDASFGVGDLRLVPKIKLLNTSSSAGEPGLALALLADLHLPTGDSDGLQGGDFRIGPRLAIDASLPMGYRIGANLGYQYRPGKSLDNLSVNDTLGWSIAGQIPMRQTLSLVAEFFGRLTPDGGIQREDSPTEFVLGAKAEAGPTFIVAGAGMGLVNGYGTPDWRAFLGIGLAVPQSRPPEPAILVEPVLEPEPEPECRAQTIAQDCPDLPPRTCSDGVLKTHTASCVEGACQYPSTTVTCSAGTLCGEGEDGEAACVVKPECAVDADCNEVPATTCNGKLLTSHTARCEATLCIYEPTQSSCEDGFACGLVKGSPGCVAEPKEEVVRIDEKKQRIELSETVFFATNSAEIEERSHPLLNQIARVLRENPQVRLVRIEGHTDSRGRRELNIRLSQARAESVMSYLIEQGIETARLGAEGFGPNRPIADNATVKGRAQNRRVELHILDKPE